MIRAYYEAMRLRFPKYTQNHLSDRLPLNLPHKQPNASRSPSSRRTRTRDVQFGICVALFHAEADEFYCFLERTVNVRSKTKLKRSQNVQERSDRPTTDRGTDGCQQNVSRIVVFHTDTDNNNLGGPIRSSRG